MNQRTLTIPDFARVRNCFVSLFTRNVSRIEKEGEVSSFFRNLNPRLNKTICRIKFDILLQRPFSLFFSFQNGRMHIFFNGSCIVIFA